jgi:predicted peptidase
MGRAIKFLKPVFKFPKQIIPITLFTFLCLLSNSKDLSNMDKETFEESDRPFFQYNQSSDYYYCLPWNYNNQSNSNRNYPLVVYLHGWWGAGKVNNLNYLGYDTDDGIDDKTAKNFQVNYPSFVLVPQSNENAWDALKVIKEIEEFKGKYRIDNNRIYLIGYSMGGSGSYILANGWYDFNQSLFAGIIRLAGQSQTTLRDEIAQKTSVWLHIGLSDEKTRINVTREAYSFLKSKHPQAVESTSNVNINGIIGTTVTLKENNTETIKKTEYKNIGHGIDIFPFGNDSLIKWLFEQEL